MKWLKKLVYAVPLALVGLLSSVPAAEATTGVGLVQLPPAPAPVPKPDPKVDPAPAPKPVPVPSKFKIVGAEKPIMEGYAVLTTTGTDDDDKVTWHVKPKPTRSDQFGNTLVLIGEPGMTYAVRAKFINWQKQKDGEDEADLPFGAPKPFPPPVPPVPPDPGPGPKPNPGPTPAPGKVSFFVVIEDTEKAGQWRGDILGSPQLAAYYKAAGLKHRLISKAPSGEDPKAVAWAKKAEGKELPYLITFDSAVNILFQGKAPTSSPAEFVKAIGGTASDLDDDDKPRKMGNIDPGEGKLRYAWTEFGSAPNVPLIPRAQWKPVNLGTFLPPVHDQDGRGQCNCSATCTSMECARAQAGLPYIYLSAGDLYSRINGGSDRGSLLEDGLAEMMQNGVCSVTLVPYVWDGRKHNDAAVVAERKLYTVTEAYICTGFDGMASALQQGFVIIEGLMWGNNYKPDRDGWLTPGGGGGGHALCGYGLEQRNGVWGIRTRNSWSEKWGIAGDCIIPEGCFGRAIGGYWAIRAVAQTKNDLPGPKTKRLSLDREFALAP